MVSIKDIENALSKVRSKGLRVIIRLRGTRNSIVMEREIRALSPEGNYISWATAFPAPPNQVIDAYGISTIEIYCGNQLIKQVNNWRDFMKELEAMGYCREA
ncbi:hypothetical protein [Vulcanisaeta thermophila]|uniref:hypothetical protein n=1 Tax=Vulcanisaeta thermophila TaxID=867917 RepID=UPI000852C611|nr:hypothetical protein [Vulcanisaeta thermophila]